MRKTRRLLLLALLIAVLGFASWLLSRPNPEPTYRGKPLTYWLDAYIVTKNIPDAQQNADEAVREIGTNAIPTLLRLLTAKDSESKAFLLRLIKKQHIINLNWTSAVDRRFEGQFGFLCLGSQAKSAMPTLLEIYSRRSPGQSNDLSWIIAQNFGFMGPAASDAVPRLAQDTTDANLTIRSFAVWALGRIHANPQLTLPALVKSLRDSEDAVKAAAAYSLGAFGSDAKSAVPELIKILDDPGSNIREDASSALKKIDPEAAAKAGVK